MSFPEGVVLTKVVDQYLDAQGRPVKGNVTFLPDLSAVGEGVAVAPVPVRRQLDKDGKFEVMVPASVNTGLDPDFTYRVQLQFEGSIFPPAKTVQIPASTDPVVLSELIDVPVPPNPVRFQLPQYDSNPLNPQPGQMYYRTTNGKAYFYDAFGEEWVSLGDGVGGPGGDDYVTEPQLNAIVIQLEAEISENALAITGLGTSKANVVHTHTIANITGLQTALDGKQPAGSYAATTHTHSISNVTGLQTALDSKASVTEVSNALALKANLDTPDFTGTPTVPTAVNGTSTTQIASTAFVGNAISALTKSSVGLGNVDNTSDANKPISTAQQTALNLKAPLASPTFTGTVSGITKSMVGLGNVDNTSDVNKPVSTAVQTALDGKAPTTHSHAVSDVTGLQAALDSKLPLIRSWNGTSYVPDTDALIFVGPTDPGAVPDGSIWIEVAP